MSYRIWLRVKLPDKELASLAQDAPDCELRQGDDDASTPNGCEKSTGFLPKSHYPTPW